MRRAEDIVEPSEAIRPVPGGREPHSDRDGAAGRDLAHVEPADLGALPAGVHRIGSAVNDIVVKRILEVAVRRTDAEQSGKIGFVLAEQQAIRILEADAEVAELRMPGEGDTAALILQRRFLACRRPAPDVAEPGLRQDMDAAPYRGRDYGPSPA